MSIALLVRQLRLEFAKDPDFADEIVRYDVGEIWQLWKANQGRHFQEGASARFCEWWIQCYETCLIVDGVRSIYIEFIRRLSLYATGELRIVE